MELEDLGGEIGEPIGGLATKVYYAKKSDFSFIADPKKMEDEDPLNVATVYKELSEITENHIFKTTKCFKLIPFTQETGDVKTKPIGAKGGKLFENEASVEIAGSKAELFGLMRAVKNEDLIVLLEEVGSGNIRQLGWSKYGASVESEHELTPTLDGKNSAKFTFKDKNLGPASIYKGQISVIPAP